MKEAKSTKVMEVIFSNCCGLDVHKKSVYACVRKYVGRGRVQQETREFTTMTRDLLALSQWLTNEGVTHVAMESTGVFWKPVYNILEDSFTLFLVNAKHVKNVPGRKTDVKDCRWLAQLMQCGLLRPSLVPDRTRRELRDLTRHRTKLVGERATIVNRIHKTLEDTNIKLASVATDIMGKSGKDMIRALISGKTNAQEIAELARRGLRRKIPELCLALEGHLTDHHKFVLTQLMDHLDYLEAQIGTFSERIEEMMRPFEQDIDCLCSMPGFDRRNAENVLAETGFDMSRFASDHHLSKWAGVAPGNNESAGKRKSSKTTPGSNWLRVALVQAAWAASRKKSSYFHAQFGRITARRGKKRAIMAVAHSLLVTIYHMLKNKTKFKDLGHDYFDRLNSKKLIKYHTKRLESLGFEITLKPKECAA